MVFFVDPRKSLALMTFEDLRAFITAVETENLSEAARRLGCSQPAVAQHVKRLEQELGTNLLVRQARGVVATTAGRLFYEGASAALDILEEAGRAARADGEQAEQSLAIACSAMAASGYLREPILYLKRRLPRVRVRIAAANTLEQRLDAVRRWKADLAFVPLVDPIPDLETRRAFQIPLRLLVPWEDRLASRRRGVGIRELSDLRYVSLGADTATHRHVSRALRAAGLAVEASETVADPTLAILAVELGHGHTFVPAVQAESAERHGLARALRVKGLSPLEMGWAVRRFERLPKAAVEFLEVFDEYVKLLGRRMKRSDGRATE